MKGYFTGSLYDGIRFWEISKHSRCIYTLAIFD